MAVEDPTLTRTPVQTFAKEVEIQVHHPEFEVSSSVQFLDADKLSTGRHRIEIGKFKDGCCGRAAFAIIDDGRVVEIETEACEDAKGTATEEEAALFQLAMDKLALPDHDPQPVQTFLANLNVGMPPPIGVSGCIKICLLGYCVTCCSSPADGLSCSLTRPSGPSTGTATPLMIFRQEIEFEVYKPDFEALASNAFLDVEKLSTGRHRVPVGRMEGPCGDDTVFANIRDGQVINIEAEGCDRKGDPVPSDVLEVFALAHNTMALSAKPPEPIAAFLGDLISIDVWGCFWICGFGYCLFCCTGDVITSGTSKCWVEKRKNSLF